MNRDSGHDSGSRDPLFYPVGWSEDGKFAYVEERTLEGICGTRTDYVILDAVTDAIILETIREDIPDGPPGEPADAGAESSAESARGSREETAAPAVQFTRALEKFGIITGEGTGAFFHFSGCHLGVGFK